METARAAATCPAARLGQRAAMRAHNTGAFKAHRAAPKQQLCRQPRVHGAWPVVRAAAAQLTAAGTFTPFRPAKPTLFDVPVSNNGARVRFVIYKKGLDVDILPPTELGGLRSEAYLALNPQGKMPLLVLPDGTAIPESEVIVQYLVRKYAHVGSGLTAASPEEQAHADLATRVMDTYINAVQGCLYKDGDAATRAAQIAQIAFQLDVLEGMVEGPYVAGDTITTADGCLLATIAWLEYILPRFFGWRPIFETRPKLGAWWDRMQADEAGAKITSELQAGLAKWDANGRWEERGISPQVADSSYKWAF